MTTSQDSAKSATSAMRVSKTLEHSVSSKDNLVILNISGRVDSTTAPKLDELLTEEVTNKSNLVLNCNGLEYVSSACLRILLKTRKRLATQGSMKLKNVNENIMEVFKITGFDKIIAIE